jgi:hypothetical protein
MEMITNRTYKGLTSVGKEESAVGFVLVNTGLRSYTNKEVRNWYAAQSSAQGKVLGKGMKLLCQFRIINNIQRMS